MKTKSTIVISIFMTLALLMGFAQASPAQARDIIINAIPTLDMTPESVTATTCGTVDVNVRVNDVVGLTGYHLEVTYDPDLIGITNVVNGGFLTNSTELPGLFEPTNWEPGDNSGTILFGMAQRGEDGDPDPKNGEGNLITISLKALVPTGSTTLTIDPLTSMLVDWPDAFEIEHTVTGGATINLSSCAPTDITLSNTSITENMAIGTVIGSLGASDPDIGDTAFTYSLVSGFGDNARFQIVGDQLRSGEVYNFEAKSTYSIKVLVTDPHGASFEKAFTISILNANDVPVMSAIDAQTVSNTGTLSFTPTATDEDGDTLTWYLGSTSPSWVNIDETTGEVTLAPTAAVEPNLYQAEVCVTDSVFPDCRMVSITVTDGVSPVLEAVSPAQGTVYLAGGENFVLTVDAADDNLYSLEIDHSFGDYSLDPTDPLYLPEFTVYASASNVYGSQEAEDAFGTYGVSVTYDETTQTWAIDFGANITNTNFIPKGVTFYLVLKDAEGNTWGSMEPTTPANTFAYSVIRDDVAPIMEAVTPPEGDVYLAGGENFVLTVDALDTNLYSLEIDHSFEGTLPEFTIYADAANPWGDPDAAAWAASLGVMLTYDPVDQIWTIDFGPTITEQFITNGVTFYLVLHDMADNTWGSMDPTTAENTYDYNLIRDNVAPVLVSVTPPDESEVKLGIGDTFTLTIVAEDVNLRELEIDHSMEDTLPEFSVYASESDPYGGDIADFTAAGVVVTYDDATQTWVIDFGATVSAEIANNGGISFYLVLEDMAGNTWGSMYGTTPENTFAYTVSQDLVAPTISSIVANGATGFPDVTAVGTTLTVDQGYKAATIDITMSEPVAVALGTQVTITPAGGVYGTVTAVNGAVITITPATGNELAAVLGTFTFSVPAGVVEDLYGNPWANVPVSLVVVDGTDPVMEAVLPAEGLITLGLDDTFVLTVDAFDLNLYELEIDHSFGGPGLTPADPLYLPEFSVYASEETPWGTEADKAMFDAAGVSISYDADLQQWTINFGEAITDSRFIPYGVTFYMVLHDEADNKWGSMDPTTSENTFAYTFEVTNTLEIEIAAAPSYLYADGYVYVGDSVFDDPNNIYTNTYSPAEFLAEDAMNDLARYLGALYRQDDSTIISIVYDGVTFTWNTAEPNTGSNWFNGTTSLVSAMVADYLATGGDLVITVQDGWHEANVTFKLVITNTLDEELESAPDYVYDPVYTYVGSRVFDDEANIYTVTYDDVDFDPNAMYDLARYLGALYRQDDSTVISIVYNGVTYTWDETGTLLGSNWVDESDNTLVSAVVAGIGSYDPLTGLVFTLSDGVHTENVTFKFVILDTTSPVLTITGAVDGSTPMAGELATGYFLPTTNDPDVNHLLQIIATSNEPLEDTYFGLYLTDTTPEQIAALEAYYADKSEPYKTYLLGALDGTTNPFVYIDGGSLTLVDAAQHDLVPHDVPMVVPDDFPLGTYTVQGVVKDAAGNETTVTLKLIVTGDRVAPTILSGEAIGATGFGDVDMVGTTFTVDQGYTVDHIEFVMSEEVTVVAGTEVTLAGVPYGFVTVDSTGLIVTVTPDAGNEIASKIGTYTFSIPAGSIKDLAGNSLATLSASLTVNNVAPVAVADTYTVAEDGVLTVPAAIGVLANDTDFDLAILTAAKVTDPAKGTLVLNEDGSFTYTPDTDFYGTDTFTYKANDGTLDSNVATVSITVTSVLDVPTVSSTNLPGPYMVGLEKDFQVTLTNPDNGDDFTNVLARFRLEDIDLADIASFQYLETALEPDAWMPLPLTQDGDDVIGDFGPASGFPMSAPYSATSQFKVTFNDAGTYKATIVLYDLTAEPDFELDRYEADVVVVAGFEVTDVVLTRSVDQTTWVNVPGNFTEGFAMPLLPSEDYYYFDVSTLTATRPLADGSYPFFLTETPGAEFFAYWAAKGVVAGASDWQGLMWQIINGDAPMFFLTVDATDYSLIDGLQGEPNLLRINGDYFPGEYAFSGTVEDEYGFTDVVPVEILFNDLPVAADQTVTTAEDTAVAVTLMAEDIYPGTLEWTVGTPTNGTLSGTAPNLTYTPNANFNGTDSFTYTANDGTADSDTATVTITVTAVNDAPVAADQAVTTPEDTAKAITLVATDADGDPLTYAVVDGPTNGTLSGTAPNLTYTPNANWNGSDSFTFKANDDTVDSNIATVSITVTAVNDAPVAEDQSVTTLEDTAKEITLVATDVDGDPLTYAVVDGPTNGTLSGTAPNLTYTPNANYSGPDSFTFKANDDTVDSNIATVSITVTAVNDAPVAGDQSVTTDEDTAKAITLAATDADGDPLTYTVVTQPAHGTLSGTAPNLTYTPNANWNGTDSFTFKANDGTVDSDTATVTITVTAVNDAPVAENQSVSTAEDTAKAITLVATDADGDPLTYTVVTQPAHGTLSGTAPNLTYTPNANYSGPDSFTFKANDGTVDSNIATVTITITAVNDAPVAVNDTYSTSFEKQLTVDALSGVLKNDSDVDGDAMTAVLVANVNNGMLALATDGSFTYTPNAGFSGVDTFTYQAKDGVLDSNIATVSITVTAYANTPPVAVDDEYETDENVELVVATPGVLTNDYDVDGDNLKVTLKTNVTNGTLALLDNGSFTYMPNADFCGTDSFVYTLVSYPAITSDGWTADATATITVYCDAIISSSDLAGPFYVGNLQGFQVRLQNPAPGHVYGSLAASIFVDDITAADFSSVEVKHPLNNTWGPLTPVVDGDGMRIDLGPIATIPLTSGFDQMLSFRVNFNTPGSYPVTGTLYDGAIDPLKAIATYSDTMVVAGLVAQDFGYMNFSDVMGVSAGFGNVNFDLSQATEIKVELFTGSASDYVLLQTNTAVDPDLMATWTQFSGPFDIFGSFDYAADGYWTNVRAAEYGQTAIPTRVLATITLPDGITLTAENTNLTGDRRYILDTLDEEIASAPGYEYFPPYTPVGTSTFEPTNNTYTGTYTAPQVLAGGPMNDMARYLGALYRQDDSTITSIVFDGITYTWNTSGTLTGSNWEDSTGKTLVSVVTAKFQAEVLAETWATEPGYTMTVHDDYDHSATVTFKLVITNTLDAEIASAPTYVYTPVYTYVGTWAFDDPTNVYIMTYDDTTFAPGAMYDLARYLGGLYRQSGATVASILYDGVTYTWDVTGTLQGSNWEDASGNTLMSVITADVLAEEVDPDTGLILTLSDVFHTENVTFKVVINDTTTPEIDTTTAIGAAGFGDVAAVGTTITVDQGYTVDHTEIVFNEPVTVAAGTVVTLGGQPYGTVSVDATGLIVTVTPYPGNAVADKVGAFVFSVPAGSIMDLAGNALETLSVTLVVNNTAPVAVADAYTVLEDTALTITAPGVLDNDVDFDPLTAALVDSPTNGSVSLEADGSFVYTPALNFFGTDTFTYKANDGTADSTIATVTITVTPVKDEVEAVDDAYQTIEGVTLTVGAPGVLANDVDPDNNLWTASLVTDVEHGTLTLNSNGSFVYVPDANFFGTDTFEYKLTTYLAVTNQWTDTAIVTITVTELSGTIEPDGGTGQVPGGTPLTITNVGNNVSYLGEIAWYPADLAIGRTAGNRVGVEINAPAGYDTTLSTFTFNGNTYDWEDVVDGDNFVWVYPLVTTTPQHWDIVVTWNPGAVQTFTVDVLTGSTLQPATLGTIERDPGNTGDVPGGTPLTVTQLGDTIDFSGEVAWYPADLTLGRTEGNRVGVEINAPAGFDTSGTTFTFAGSTYTWDVVKDGDNFVWIYPKVTATPQSWDIVVTWETGNVQTFTVNVLTGATLEIPVVGTIEPDGGTGQIPGGAPLTITNVGDNVSYLGEIAWYPEDLAIGRTAGNRVGVEINAPVGFDTSETTFTFAGSTYTWDDVLDGDNFVWIYPKVTASPQHWDIVVTWRAGVVQTFSVDVLADSTLQAPIQGTIEPDGGTGQVPGGTPLTITNVGDNVSYLGEIAWYPADTSVGRNVAGHWVGVEINAPAGFDTSDTTFTINGGTAYDWDLVKDGDNFVWVYPLVTTTPQHWDIVVTWEAGNVQTFTVDVLTGSTLQPATLGTIERDPGNTGDVPGGTPLTVTQLGDIIDFAGEVAWYPADLTLGRTEGNRVGVQINAPAGFDTSGTTFTFAGSTYTWDVVKDGDDFVWIYPKVTAVPQSWDIVVTWETGNVQTFTVNVLTGTTLDETLALEWLQDNTVLSSTTDMVDDLTATFPGYIPAAIVDQDYVIDSRLTLSDALPVGSTVTVSKDGVEILTDITLTGTGPFWFTELFDPDAPRAAFDTLYGGLVEEYSIIVTGPAGLPADFDTTVLIESVISKDAYLSETVLDDITLGIHLDDAGLPKIGAGVAKSASDGDVNLVDGKFTVNQGYVVDTIELTMDEPVLVELGTIITMVGHGPYGTVTAHSSALITITPYSGNEIASVVGSFSFTAPVGAVTDLTGNAFTGSIGLEVLNVAPVAVDDTYTVAEDGILTISAAAGVLVNDTDFDPTVLTAELVDGPDNGTLVLNSDGSFNYTPETDWTGADTFTYKANDGTADSNTATVTITVTPVNDAPVALAQSVTTEEDTAKAITLAATDIDGDTLTYAIVSQPSHGMLTLVGNVATYTPVQDYHGPDSFTFKANDGTVDSNIATVSITVTEVKDQVQAVDDAYETGEDTTLTVTAPGVLENDIDVDGNSQTAVLVSGPTNGALTLNSNGSFVYIPNANWNGEDSFVYQLVTYPAPKNLWTDEATVTITVTAVNDAPVAADQSVTTTEDTAKEITLVATDVDGDTLTYSIVTGPANGTLSVVDGAKVTYTPNADYTGSDSFTFKANDGTVDSNIATVSITVTAVNDAPLAADQSVTTPEDTAKEITLVATDIDGDPLTYSIVTGPANGTLSVIDGAKVTYTPNANYSGSDSFTFKANDGTLDSNIATVSITVAEVNDAPVAQNQTVTTDEEIAIAINLVATDVDNTTLTFSIVVGPANGTLSTLSGNQLTYTPNADYTGSDSFTFKANDGTLDSNIATVTININPVNDAPVAVDDEYTMAEKDTLTIAAPGVLGNDSDVDGDAFTAILIDTVTNGTLTLNADGSFTYTPNEYFNGTDSFTYKAKDAVLESDLAVVTITVTPVNDWPIANDDYYETPTGIDLVKDAVEGILANDVLLDPDEEVSIEILDAPEHGMLSMNNDGSFTYTPYAGFMGTDTFHYLVHSVLGKGEWSDDAMVTIVVKPYMGLYLPLILR